MTTQDTSYLRTISKALRNAETHVGDIRARRDESIRDAYANGMTQDEIASLVGLSQVAVSKIIRSRSGADS